MSTHTSTLQVNDIVFIEGIGYGTLVDCGSLKNIVLKEPALSSEKKQSIYFDPDMFNSEPDSLGRRKSQVVSAPPDLQQPPHESTLPVTNSEPRAPQPTAEQQVNLVKLKLEGSSVYVYTPDTNIRKYVRIPVRPLFAPALGVIHVKIDIGKTIESLRREIFDLLGLKHAHYFNTRFFTTSPGLQELSMQGKTIWQYGIKESSIITVTAEHGFCFEPLPPNMHQLYSLLNNNLTFVSMPAKPKQTENVVIALPPPPQTPATTGSSPEVEQKPVTQQPLKPEPEPPKPESEPPKPDAKNQPSPPNSNQAAVKQEQGPKKLQEVTCEMLFCNGDKYIRSGKHYFEVKLDKLPTNPQHLKIGLATPNNTRKYLFAPLVQERAILQNQQLKQTSGYGTAVKQGDTIGVLINIGKQRRMKIVFYKNNASLGLCFEDSIQQVHAIFGIGSEAQISLDTRAQQPLDSYRF